MNTAFVLLSGVTLFGCVYDVSSIVCKSGWFHHAQSCYHFSHNKDTWESAAEICERLDSMLAEIETVAEDQFLQNYVTKFNVNYWVGGTDLEQEGVWTWMSSQTQLNYSNWAPNEPNSVNTDENCIDLRPHRSGWNDERCWQVQNYVCEIDGEDTPGIVG